MYKKWNTLEIFKMSLIFLYNLTKNIYFNIPVYFV